MIFRNIFIVFFVLFIMVIGITLFVISVLIIAIWIIIEIKRMKHKLMAIFLIGLILFLYLSFSFVFKSQDIEWKTIPGLMKGTNLYFSWLGSAFGNLKSITSYAIKQDWKGNETAEKEDTKFVKFFSSEDK